MAKLTIISLFSIAFAFQSRLGDVVLLDETGYGLFTLGMSGNFQDIAEPIISILNQESEANCIIEKYTEGYITCSVAAAAGVYQTRLEYETPSGEKVIEICDRLSCRLPLYVDAEAVRLQKNQPVRPRDRILDGRRSDSYAEPPGNSVPKNDDPERFDAVFSVDLLYV